MGGGGKGGGGAPPPPPPPVYETPPPPQKPEVTKNLDEVERARRMRLASGYEETIATGGSGLMSAPPTNAPTLLGA